MPEKGERKRSHSESYNISMSIRDEEKLRRFAEESLGEAEATAAKINAEVDSEEARRLTEGEHKILQAAYEHIQTELKSIRRENSQILSREIMETRRELLLYREELMHRVFDKAREKITEFVASDGYKDYLVKLCQNVLRRQSASFTLYMSPRDLMYKYDVLEGLDNLLDEKLEMGTTEAAPVYSVMPDKSIKLGGVLFYSAARGISINATFDENLAHQKEFFTGLLGPVSADTSDIEGKDDGN